MEHILYCEGDREEAFIKGLRARCIEEMDRIGDEESGAKLSLLPGGIGRLRWQSCWRIDTAIRVAIFLDILAMKELERCVGVDYTAHTNSGDTVI